MTVTSGSSTKVTSDAIVIAGIPIRKENTAASSALIPSRSAAPIVLPDREIPGATAIPCAMPMTSDFLAVISPAGGFAFDAIIRKIPVTISRQLTINGW